MNRNYRVQRIPLLVLALAALLAMAAACKSTVPAKTQVHDAEITTKVKAELAKDKGTSARDIHVTTKDGVVMLDGTVASQAEKELAEHDAKRIKGVLAVHNGLTVQ